MSQESPVWNYNKATAREGAAGDKTDSASTTPMSRLANPVGATMDGMNGNQTEVMMKPTSEGPDGGWYSSEAVKVR
jgi:hypothetical protein